jgi:hypothetical protein
MKCSWFVSGHCRAELPGAGEIHVAAQRSRLGEADSVEERSGVAPRAPQSLDRENDVIT